MPAEEPQWYTPSKYIKRGSIETDDGESFAQEWQTVIPKLLGFADIPSWQAKINSLRGKTPKALQSRLDGLFSAHFDKAGFSRPLEILMDDVTRFHLPNPFSVVGQPNAVHRVGALFIALVNGNLSMSIKHVDILANRALQPVLPFMQPICNWLASADPMSEMAPVATLRHWLEENGQSADLAESETFLQALVWGMERNLEDSLQFSFVDPMSEMEMEKSGTHIVEEEGFVCLCKDI